MHHYEGENPKIVWGGVLHLPSFLPRWGGDTPQAPPPRRLRRLDSRTFGARPRLDKFRKSNPGIGVAKFNTVSLHR